MKEITATELRDKIDDPKFVLIDVREEYEHEEFNIGGVLIPLGSISSSIDQLRGFGDVELVFYCRSGNRSGMAQKILAVQFDMHNTINLKGGMIAWKANE